MNKIVVYDFDRTIFQKDASFEFWKFALMKKPSIIKRFPLQFGALILNKLKLIETKKFKEIFFSFIRDLSEDELRIFISEFWCENRQFISEWFLKRKKEYIEIVISASPEWLLKDICKSNEIDVVIATLMNKKGVINGENCKGEEKVKRLNMLINEYEIIMFYSDSYNDLPLAKLAQKSYFVKKGKVQLWVNC